MIITYFVERSTAFLTWFISLFPKLDVSQIAVAEAGITNIAETMWSMSVWVNWAALGGQIFTVMGLYFVFLAIRVLRAVLGHVPIVGGNG